MMFGFAALSESFLTSRTCFRFQRWIKIGYFHVFPLISPTNIAGFSQDIKPGCGVERSDCLTDCFKAQIYIF